MLFHTCADDNNKYTEFKKVKGIRIDRRTVDMPDYKSERDSWCEIGQNHRVENGMITREFDNEFFVIELNSLEDLLKFQDKYGTNASVSKHSGYSYKSKELNSFHHGYYME